MANDATGAAFIDRSGTVVAADAAFTSRLGLPDPDPEGAGLRHRAEQDPALRALLAGEGPDVARVAGAGSGAIELERLPAPEGAFLIARAPGATERDEHAVRSEALPRIAAGLAHDIKNPLNAMALQIALLSEKLDGAADGAAATHLAALRDQIGRVNEVVRRFLEVADPSAPLGFIDLGALVSDAVALFAHEARRRRVELVLDAPPGLAPTRADPARLGRLALVLVAGAMGSTPDGGRMAARLIARGGWTELTIEHAAGDQTSAPRHDLGVAAATAVALGGSLASSREGALERLLLRLPVNG
jgi:signal transduction histidine kinase